MRSDARRRREALLLAARESFSRSGYLVPLEEIAERAGVSRATLYRRFPDRMALVLAIFDEELEQTRVWLAKGLTLKEVVSTIALESAPTFLLYSRLAADMPLVGPNLVAFERLGERFRAMLEPYVRRAYEDRALRREFGAKEVMLCIRMIGGVLTAHMSQAEMRAVADEAVAVLFDGLSPKTD